MTLEFELATVRSGFRGSVTIAKLMAILKSGENEDPDSFMYFYSALGTLTVTELTEFKAGFNSSNKIRLNIDHQSSIDHQFCARASFSFIHSPSWTFFNGVFLM
jgi:hypothetical protein